MVSMTRRSVQRWTGLAMAGVLAFAACGGGGGGGDTSDGGVGTDEAGGADTEEVEPEVRRGKRVAAPLVTGPVTAGERGLPFNPLPAVLAEEFGYVEEEFFIAGEASAYAPQGEWDEDGEWAVRPTQTAPYRTRLLVRQPADAEAFNGTVVVEWLNVTSGIDLDAVFAWAPDELLRSGYVWVGASVQHVSIEGGGGAVPGLEVLALKDWDPERYGDLDHPGDDYAYDIYSQVAQAIRRPEGADPLDGLAARHVIATGASQSAWFMVTYVNAVHPIADIYDGFLVHSRPFTSGFPLADAMPAVARIRTDLSDPVMQFQTETELFGLNFLAARQPDTEQVRTWEVAGTAHSGRRRQGEYVVDSIRAWDESYDPDFLSSECSPSDGPHSLVLQAAWAALTEWVAGGEPPAQAEPIEVEDGAIARDRHGNARGGVRTPAVDAPIATLTGEDDDDDCGAPGVGSTTPLDQATLASLYPTHQNYVEAVRAATQTAVDAGFLLPIDGDAIINEAEQAPIPD